MTVHTRLFTATDYPALAPLLSEQEKEPTTAERLADQDARRPPYKPEPGRLRVKLDL